MNRLMLPLIILLTGTTAFGDANSGNRYLFTFDGSDALNQWRTVNDGVMGGRSVGRVRINRFRNLEFFGELSLANNGGFASVRARGSTLNLRDGDSIVIRVRGDGRDYSLNLYTPVRRMAFSYRAPFQTKKNEWVDVTVPLSRFVPTSFGRVVRGSSLNPQQVSGIGVLLGDKKAGPFQLEIESISVRRSSGDSVSL